ncbi:MAG: hypothetical protein GY772_19020 [bacterium]|nr:hypothetical protein [bacterium]MCP4242652.1 hypothetical protein [bacterium]MCP4742206.1 hypothetical protein [Actinomycetales bacterium]
MSDLYADRATALKRLNASPRRVAFPEALRLRDTQTGEVVELYVEDTVVKARRPRST